ncbi:hypothetical protein FF098_013635 [Parvularcula flava]|uniref:HTH-type transcriptional regulator n=1 Tax=Aquisalinus luteolus TaxID=1566827 RepID=A0A8J3ESC9_9PROT|nr:hypothetical protein [Aquisalinus luteolus]NHK28959.1 hypothetical protein [Aquisalinus luteolus]GGI00738.1 hypothetical protein GCM10011355_29740 [Aquisalinus luteolus]
MTASAAIPKAMPDWMQHFTEYFAGLGARWGMDADLCRVHAWLYLTARPVAVANIATALSLPPDTIADVVSRLKDMGVASKSADGKWSTGGDPWALLLAGLEQRRREEVPMAQSTFGRCLEQAKADGAAAGTTARLEAINAMAGDIAALDAQASRLSPERLRQIVGLTGRTARFFNRLGGKGR